MNQTEADNNTLQNDDEETAEMRHLIDRLETLYAQTGGSGNWFIEQANQVTGATTHFFFERADPSGERTRIMVGRCLSPELAELTALSHTHLLKLIQYVKAALKTS